MTRAETGALSRHLDVAVAPALPEALVSSTSFSAMRELTSGLPAALTEFFGLECRLWSDSADADLLLHVAAPPGRSSLAALAAASSSGSDAHAVAWRRLHDFAAAWAEPSHVLYGHVAGTWLEFDLAEATSGISTKQAPSLFMATHITSRSHDVDTTPASHAADRGDWLFDSALPMLLGQAAAERHRAHTRPLLEALPASAHVFQVGVMLSRASDALRLCVRGLGAQQTLAFLVKVGWPGRVDELAPWLADASALCDSVDLDLDVGPEVHAKIGLECSCLQRPAPYGRQPAFLEYLVAHGLCTPAKAEGLRVWPRGFHERTDPERWPVELRERARAMGNGTVSMFLRWLYHVKLVVQPGVMPVAKAYLAVRQVWPNPSTMAQIASSGEAYLSGTASTKRA